MKILKCIIAVLEKHFASIIIAIAIIAAAIIYAYYNPYQSCKRDLDMFLIGEKIPRICSGSG